MHTTGRHTCRTGMDKAGLIVLLTVVFFGPFMPSATPAQAPRLRSSQKQVALVLVPEDVHRLRATVALLAGHGAREAS